jgi:hypothetical protein
MNLHQLEEIEYRDGPKLWDADPDVCCAAYQLGACSHTEDASLWDEEGDDLPFKGMTMRDAAGGSEHRIGEDPF